MNRFLIRRNTERFETIQGMVLLQVVGMKSACEDLITVPFSQGNHYCYSVSQIVSAGRRFMNVTVLRKAYLK